MKWQDLEKNKLAQEKLNTRNKKYIVICTS